MARTISRAKPERRYSMIRLRAGDYILPGNDCKTFWRVHKYIEGPSSGLDWPRDREVWGYWKWFRGDDIGAASDDAILDWENWDRWGWCYTRREAVDEALSTNG